jgi:ATP-dependent phosphoenolpyruvate carboxykinase
MQTNNNLSKLQKLHLEGSLNNHDLVCDAFFGFEQQTTLPGLKSNISEFNPLHSFYEQNPAQQPDVNPLSKLRSFSKKMSFMAEKTMSNAPPLISIPSSFKPFAKEEE